jgi:Flp pilus assembly protein TadB
MGAAFNIIIIFLIAGSFRAELASVRDDSILGIDGDTIEQLSKRPTLGLGITYFALYVIWYASFVVAGLVYPVIGFILSYSISFAVFLIATGFFIIYWVKLNRIRRKIAGLTI